MRGISGPVVASLKQHIKKMEVFLKKQGHDILVEDCKEDKI